jgi:lipopolysaccharide transport system ATP-binding protein
VGKRYVLGGTGARGLLVDRLHGAIRAPLNAIGRGLGRGVPPPRAAVEELWAVRDVSFEVQYGDALALVGRNGAGKSTLLKLVSRISRPTTGQVTTYGRVATLLEVGTGFHVELTGRENIFLNGSILGMRRKEILEHFDEIVEFSGVERFLDTPFKRYSDGMKVRLAFAVAAHLRADIMLVDEVLAVGDGEFQRKCLGAMRDVTGEGRAVVFVSHNLHAVQRLCNRAFLLDSGRVLMEGNPREVVAEYSHRVGLGQVGSAAEIADDAPRFGSGEVRIRRVQMIDGNGMAASVSYLREPIRIRTTLEVFEPIPQAAAEIGITSVDGERLITVQNIDGDRPPMRLEPGIHEIETAIDTSLLPNEYTIDVGFHTIAGVTMDWLEGVIRFTALNAAVSGGDHYRWPGVRGYVRPESSWSTPLPTVHERQSEDPPPPPAQRRPPVRLGN